MMFQNAELQQKNELYIVPLSQVRILIHRMDVLIQTYINFSMDILQPDLNTASFLHCLSHSKQAQTLSFSAKQSVFWKNLSTKFENFQVMLSEYTLFQGNFQPRGYFYQGQVQSPQVLITVNSNVVEWKFCKKQILSSKPVILLFLTG